MGQYYKSFFEDRLLFLLGFSLCTVINVIGFYFMFKWDWFFPINHSLTFLQFSLINTVLLIFGALFYRFLRKRYNQSGSSDENKLLMQYLLMIQTLIVGMSIGLIVFVITDNYMLLTLFTYYVVTGAVIYDMSRFHFIDGSGNTIRQ